MGTNVIVRQEFEQGRGTVPAPPLESCVIGPLHRTVTRGDAGQYDTTDTLETCLDLPDGMSTAEPRIDFYREVYGSPVFVNAHHPHLTQDAETHLANIQDNLPAFRFFREGPEDRVELSEAAGGWADNGIFNSFHEKLVPGSVVVARKHTIASFTVSTNPIYLTTSSFPSNNDGGGSHVADGIVPGTVRVTHADNDNVVYLEGSDWTLTYDFDAGNPGGRTNWRLDLPAGSRLSTGDAVKLTFEGKFPFKYGTGLDIEPDYENGSLQNVMGVNQEVDDAIVYYGFWPVVSVAAYIEERKTADLTQLDGTDYTVKDVGGVQKLCLRPGLQGPLASGDTFVVGTRIDEGNFTCGTIQEEFCINDVCDEDDPKDKLKFCFYRGLTGGSPVEESITLQAGPDLTAADIVSDLNSNGVFSDYAVAYDDGGYVCWRLRDPSKGDGADEVNTFDMRGADNWIELKPTTRDAAPVLGLAYGKLCGKSRYPVTDTGQIFQDLQDASGFILGSVLIDIASNRYRIDRINSDSELEVTHVDASNVAVCGSGLTAPDGSDEYGIYFPDWSARILVTYGAVRNDLGDELIELQNSSDDMVAKLSEDGTTEHFSLGPENPLAYALAGFCFPNTSGSILALPLKSDDLSGYQTAIEVLELSTRPHLLVPLTFDADVHGAIEAHITDMSEPGETAEPQTRVGVYAKLKEDAEVVGDLANDSEAIRFSANPAARTYSSSTVDSANYVAATGAAKVFRLVEGSDSTVNFVSDGVKPGDLVRIHFGANAGDWRVLRLLTTNGGLNCDELELTGLESTQRYQFDTLHSECFDPATPSGTNQNGLVSYTIYRRYTKSNWAIELEDLAAGHRGATYSYRGVVTMGMLFVDDSTPDGRSGTYPGYYLNAGLAGACATVPVQQGFTNYPMHGTGRVLFSKGYFTFKQLRAIESQGVWIWQTNDGADFYYSREQFTVDGYNPAAVLSSQLHIVRIADRMHRRYYRALIGFTGIYNITQANIGMFRMVLEATIQAAKDSKAPRVGPELKDGVVNDLRCDPNNARTLLVSTLNIPPESINTFDITNRVRRG